MSKYRDFIKLNPYYESVVDLDAEERNPDLWKDYIVQGDMVKAIEKISASIVQESTDDRRSFWIHGPYGTGKSYAAIVLKHLFEDSIDNVSDFLDREALKPYKSKFLGIREKGEFFVVWRSGCTGISNGVQLMMEMELDIRKQLDSRFGPDAYYGETSLISSVQEAIEDPAFNWGNIFNDPIYGLSDNWESWDALKTAISNNQLDAVSELTRVIKDKGWGLFKDVDNFEKWIADIIEGNHLEKTGIVFIWDEFTGYLRNSGDDNVLQRLSEYCKVQPFFLCLIVHKDSSWVENMGTETYDRILHRYHELFFHITGDAAYDLISDSIIIQTGMEEQWKIKQNELMKTIQPFLPQLEGLLQKDMKDKFRKLCPIHPMSLKLLTVVSEQFGASQRSLFRFMKDTAAADKKLGFPYYIENHGPDNGDWFWLTPDFLWDYFYLNGIDTDLSSATASKCYRHYSENKFLVEKDKKTLHVFKTCMLLLASLTTSSTGAFLVSQRDKNQLAPTKECLINCYCGLLRKDEIEACLKVLSDSNILRINDTNRNVTRLELPYSGGTDQFETHLETNLKTNTVKKLLNKDSSFGQRLKDSFFEKSSPTTKRMQFISCSCNQRNINDSANSLISSLKKRPYTLGFLLVVPEEDKDYNDAKYRCQNISMDFKTEKRFAVCLTKKALTHQDRLEWCSEMTHSELAGEEGKEADKQRYTQSADSIVEKWVQNALNHDLMLFYQEDIQELHNGITELHSKSIKSILEQAFPYAPEFLIIKGTLYNASKETAALAGLTGEASSSQYKGITDALINTNLTDISTIAELSERTQNSQESVVGHLAGFIKSQMDQGTSVKLDDLWSTLCKEPFGYYNCLACAGLLGFVFKYYTDSTFNWIDAVNNPIPLTTNNLATMINEMCKGKVEGHVLSQGSESWQRYRPYLKSIFKLEEKEIATEQSAFRKIRELINQSGLPFWLLAYGSDDDFGGSQDYDKARKIISNINSTIIDNTDQSENLMSETIDLFKGNGILRKEIATIFSSENKRYSCLLRFISEKNPVLYQQVNDLGIPISDLALDIQKQLQGAIYTWTEEDVLEATKKLESQYTLLLTLNRILKTKETRLSANLEKIRNVYHHLAMPDAVMQQMGWSWYPAVIKFHDITLKTWDEWPVEEQTNVLGILNQWGQIAWDNITSPLKILKEYLDVHNIIINENELNTILLKMGDTDFNGKETIFKDTLYKQLDHIEFEKKKSSILNRWEEITHTKSIAEWCSTYEIPIKWVVKEENYPYFCNIKNLQEDSFVNIDMLRSVNTFICNEDFAQLIDKNYLSGKFESQIYGDNLQYYRTHRSKLIKLFKSEIGPDVFNWYDDSTRINNLIQIEMRKEAKEQEFDLAKTRIETMDDKQLRNIVIKLINEKPEYSKRFLSDN